VACLDSDWPSPRQSESFLAYDESRMVVDGEECQFMLVARGNWQASNKTLDLARAGT
jgi:hypothetical protein